MFSLVVAAAIAWVFVVVGRWRTLAAGVSMVLLLATLAVLCLDASEAWARVVGWNLPDVPVALQGGFYLTAAGATVAAVCAGAVLIGRA
ncbi:MAG: hypothetical protein ACLQGJ_08640 [Candidatus Dormibacteria bacterium]